MSLLLLLQTRGRTTAAELAEELEVSVRTIYRDMEALSAAGVPVYAEAGPYGGCQLLEGYRTRLTGLTAKEAEALFASGVPGPVGELGLGTVLGAAQLKLLAALPKDLADRAALARQRFHLDAPSWFKAGRNEPHLAELAAAVWDDRCVDIRYRHPGAAEAAERHLEPLGLVLKAGVWYLVARRDSELRTYRVSRIERVTPGDDTFERPEGFDLAAHWRASVSQYEASMATVAVVVRERGTDGATWVEREVTFESLDDAYVQLLLRGPEVEVVEPTPLRARLAAVSAGLHAIYAS